MGASLADLAWLQGSWICDKDGGIFEEHWMAPSAGSIQGVGKLVVGGKTAFMEFMSLEETDDGITMWMILGSPSKGEQRRVPFKLISVRETSAVFDLPTNGFPSRISYELNSDKNLTCTLSGIKAGQEITDFYDFAKMSF